MVEISASLLSLKSENTIQTLYNLETAKIDYFHIDVMDGEFVENDTVSRMTEYCEYLSSISNLPLDVHLMVKDVPSYISSFLVFEPNIITFHLEAAKDKEQAMEWIKLIKENNVRVGISVKPDTKIEEVAEFLPFVHLVLVMTVEPGKGGQELIPKTVEKIRALKKYVQDKQIEVDIEADGGINLETVAYVKEAGADIVVAGSAITNSENYADVVKKMKGGIQR
ncbi:MAG: ribulose-phosphate 3-epimerase [Clostridia bacterium]|nr:ribulose-phosphate 3-epimerase [Clostridia bacterium]